jgi:hypothetical protein
MRSAGPTSDGTSPTRHFAHSTGSVPHPPAERESANVCYVDSADGVACETATVSYSLDFERRRLTFRFGRFDGDRARVDDGRPVVAEKTSRRGRLYSIRGRDSPVTGAAIRVNVAGGVRDRFSPVRRARRRLAPARKPRRRGPRAPSAARRAQARQAPAAASPDRPPSGSSSLAFGRDGPTRSRS